MRNGNAVEILREAWQGRVPLMPRYSCLMPRTQHSGLRRYLVDHLHELAEEIERVVGAGGSFGVVLDGQDGLAAVAEALQGLVVEVDVRVLDVVLAEGVGVDGEAVVLGGDLDAS